MRTFYRVCNENTFQGLWYDSNGGFTGLIHDEFSFCKNRDLKMDFDPELVGWLSAVPELDDLWKWFSGEDVLNLQEHGWYIHEYETDQYRFYERFQHNVISQKDSIVKRKLTLYEIGCHECKFESFSVREDRFYPCGACSPHQSQFHYTKRPRCA